MLRTLIALLAMLGLQQPVAPAPGELSEKVVARDGSALPGVIVTLQAPPPAAPRQVVARGDGTYRLDNVAPGTYSLQFELNGFATYTRTRLVVTPGQQIATIVGLDHLPAKIDLSQFPLRESNVDPSIVLVPGEQIVGIETSLGTFHIAVDTKRAPITSANFLKYVEAGLYDNGRFHRATRADNYTPVLPSRPMMNIIQGGIDQSRRSQGFPAIPLERTSVTGIKHVTGVVSMARGTGADTATSDFFVLLDDQPSLDFGGLRFDDGQGGAAFGHVLLGLDVVKKIQQQPVDGQNLTAPVMIRRAWHVGGIR